MRKILRNMYKREVPRRFRRKTYINGYGEVIYGTWHEWKKNRKVA